MIKVQKRKTRTINDPSKIRELCMRYEREISTAKDYMFWFLLVWTTLLLVLQWASFVNLSRKIPESMIAGYGILLGAYIVHKEVGRWAGIGIKARPGEVFVYIWWGMFLSMFVLEYLRPNRFEIPASMPMLSYEVLGYFLFSEVSKAINRWKNSKADHLR